MAVLDFSDLTGEGGEGGGGGTYDPADDFVQRIQMQEDPQQDPNAVSPAGARGLMQVKDATNFRPGYGVRPAADNSPQERVRVGQDYAKALRETYGDETLAASAYNAGPGTVDGLIKKYGDPRTGEVSWDEWLSHLPKETRDYVANVAPPGGAETRQARAGQSNALNFDDLLASKPVSFDDLLQTPAPSPFNLEAATGALQTADKYLGGLSPEAAARVQSAGVTAAREAATPPEQLYGDFAPETQAFLSKFGIHPYDPKQPLNVAGPAIYSAAKAAGIGFGLIGSAFNAAIHGGTAYARQTLIEHGVPEETANGLTQWLGQLAEYHAISPEAKEIPGSARIGTEVRPSAPVEPENPAADAFSSATARALGTPLLLTGPERPPAPGAAAAPPGPTPPIDLGPLGNLRPGAPPRPTPSAAPPPEANAPGTVIPARPVAAAADDTAITSTGREVPVKYAVVEANSLTPSQTLAGGVNPNFPRELQPRDRSRLVSAAQIANIAQNLNPRLLDRSPTASDGAPIISPDGIVESGNGRTLAIQQAYAEGRDSAGAYRKYLADSGYPVEGMKNPVLVRIRQGTMAPDERQAFVREANQSGTAGYSATEQALADAAALPDSSLDLYRGGDIDAVGNQAFVRDFAARALTPAEYGKLVDTDGALSQDGIRRVQNALLAKAYGDPGIIAKVIESKDSEIKAIGGALLDSSAEWARLRADAKDGTIPPEMDQTPHIMAAVSMVDRARREGRPLSEYTNQRDLMTGQAVDPAVEGWLSLMFRDTDKWKGPVGRAKLNEAISNYVTKARKAPGLTMPGLAATQPADIVSLARRKLEKSYGKAGPGGTGEGIGEAGVPGAGQAAEGGEAAQGDQAARSRGGAGRGAVRFQREEREVPEPPLNPKTGKKITAEPLAGHLAILRQMAREGDVQGLRDAIDFHTEPGMPAHVKGEQSEVAAQYARDLLEHLGQPAGPPPMNRETIREANGLLPGPKPDPRKRLIEQVGPVRVYEVDGNTVRNRWFLDFTEGGNDHAYKEWFPKNEVWIDGSNKTELGPIILHELHERNLMRDEKMGYEDAHDRANVIEHYARNNPDELPKLLQKERDRLTAGEPKFATEPGAVDAKGNPLPQMVIPGAEASTRQLAAAREAEGRGKIQPRRAQEAPGGLFGEPPPKPKQGTLFERKQLQTPEFKRWFGDSKVVDEKGEPLRVYHGTATAPEAFDASRAGSSSTHPTAALGFFFTDNPDLAGQFADEIDTTDWPPKRLPQEGANLVPAYLSIKNPMRMTAEKWRDVVFRAGANGEPGFIGYGLEQVRRWRQKIEAAGFDGVHVIGDPKYRDSLSPEYGSDNWVAFRPEQIKSAVGNRGTFDPNDPRINYERKPGAATRMEGGALRRVIGDDTVAHLPTNPSPAEKAIIEEVSRIAQRIVPKAEVIPARNITVHGEAAKQNVAARVMGSTVLGPRRLIAWSLESKDPVGTMRHEAIHWLRDAGFFRPGEWRAMEHAARAGDWIGKHDIGKRYGDFDQDTQTEEAIAEHFNQWRRAPKSVPAFIRPIYEKLARLLGRVGDFLRRLFGADVSADDVFSRIEAGEIGSRGQYVPPRPGAVAKSGFGKRPSALMQRAQEQAGSTTETVGVGADLKRLIDLFGPKMYAGNMPNVTVKELLQNSFDAVKAALARGDIRPGEGVIHIDQNDANRTVRFTDNGAGMSPETVKDAFLTIAGTNKGDLTPEESSGGFGVAKLAFIFGNKSLHVDTVRDGVRTVLSTTGKELLDGKAKLVSHPTTLPNGTTVQVEFPETYKNQRGEEEHLWMPYNVANYDALGKPLLGDVEVRVSKNGREPTTLPIGRNSDMSETPKVTTAHFPWGDIDVYMKREEKDYPNHSVLSSGMYQFDSPINKKLLDFNRIPYRVIYDVRPKVKAADPMYPFNNQREGWSNKIKSDVVQLDSVMRRKFYADEAQNTGGTFSHNVVQMPLARGTYQPGQQVGATALNLAQHLPKAENFDIQPHLHIDSGKIRVGGESRDISKEAEAVANPKDFNFQPEQVPSDQPLLHSNLNVDVIAEAARRAGIEPAESMHFLASIGTVVQDFRDALAKLGEQYTSWGEPGHPVGVSLDRQYHGVHISVPYNGFFLNPLAVRTDTIGGHAASLMHTLLHEAAHTVAKNHSEDFTMALAKLEGDFEDTHPGLRVALQNRLRGIIEANEGAFDALREVYNDPATENIEARPGGIKGAVEQPGRTDGLLGRSFSLREEQQLGSEIRRGSGKRVSAGEAGRDTGRPLESVKFQRPTPPGQLPLNVPGAGDVFGWIRGQEDELFRMRQANEADKIEALKVLQSLPAAMKDPALRERLYERAENAITLPTAEEALFQQYVKPWIDRGTALYNSIRRSGYPVTSDGYVHRIVKGKGSMYDEPAGANATNPIYSGSLTARRTLSRKAPSLEARTMFAAEGDRGTVRIVTAPDFKVGDTWYENGERFRVRQATTREIEENTNLRYFKDGLINSIDNALRLQRAKRNIDYLERLKADPAFFDNAAGPNARDVPRNWVTTKLPQLAGWRMDPRIAAMVDDFYQPGFGLPEILGRINHALTTSIFINPVSSWFGHGSNVAAHWFVGRGWQNFMPHTWGRTATNLVRAARDVNRLSPQYLRMMREGSALMYAPTVARDFHQTMIKAMGGEMQKNPATWAEIAKRAGTTPLAILRGLNDISSRGLWYLNDVLMLGHVYDLMDRGRTARAAIAEAEADIPNYRIPTEAWNGPGGRAVSQILQDPNFLIFSRYRYGMMKAYASVLGNTVKGTGPGRVEGIGKLVALTALIAMIYPLADKAVQMATGDDDAKLRRAGPASVVDAMAQYRDGEVPLTDAIHGLVSPAPGTSAILQTAANQKSFNGKHIYNPEGSLWNAAKDIGAFWLQQMPPVQQGTEIATGARTPGQIGEQQFGIKPGPAGGPAQAYSIQLRKAHADQLEEQLPRLRRQFQSGDREGALRELAKLGIPPHERMFYARSWSNPTGVFRTPRYATPEQAQKLRQLQGGRQ